MEHSMEKLHHPKVAPKIRSLQSLKEITDNFSEEQKLGCGTYGKVYKGVKNGEEIAVKLLHVTPGCDDLEQFRNEFENLKKLRHRNIVQLLGYCYEIKHEYVELNDGKTVFAQNIYRALCFDYMHNGSLQKHLYDEYHGLEWHTRYQIIKGTCEGLKYLHEGLESPIYHLDLKPDNILLDTNMVPKIADFGLSKLVGNEQTQATGSFVGTIGYLPPEFIEKNLVSNKLDIFSLGVVIIKVMAGEKGYHKHATMSSQEFIDVVHENWRDRLKAKAGYMSLEAECHQVKRCLEIALDCVHADRKKRPTIGVIVNLLNETEKMNKVMELPLTESRTVPVEPTDVPVVYAEKLNLTSMETELLDIYPSELRFPFEPKKKIQCTLNLTNKGDDGHVYFIIRSNNPDRYCTGWLAGCVRPNFTLAVTVVMKEQEQPPALEDEFQIIMMKKVVEEWKYEKFREMGGQEVSLMAVICDADPASEAIRHHGSVCHVQGHLGNLICIDVHPTEPWILTAHDKGYVSIIKVKSQGSTITVQRFLHHHSQNCVSVKFIATRKWVVSGDCKGYIHVYTYIDGLEEIKKWKAHRGAVRSLAVHPTHQFLLSSSDDHRIKRWDWDNGWACTREYRGHSSTIRHVMFNPRDTNIFASVSGKYNSLFIIGSIKIWSVDSSDPIRDWYSEGNSAACYLACSDGQYMAMGREGEQTKIWDIESERYVHGLEEHSSRGADVVAVASHPTLPILVTGTNCGHICLWNSKSYRLEKKFQFTDNAVEGFGFVDVDGFKSWIVIGYSNNIDLVEINWPHIGKQDSL